MPAHGETRADANRRIRREALRDQLEATGLVQQVIDTTKLLADLNREMESLDVQRLRAANESRLKLINKYLPDAKDDQVVNLNGTLGIAEMTEDELNRRIEQLNQSAEG